MPLYRFHAPAASSRRERRPPLAQSFLALSLAFVLAAALGGLACGGARPTALAPNSGGGGGNGGGNPPTPAALAVTTASLPAAQAQQSYSATLAASGGAPPYAWSLASGQLPAGVTLSAAGQLSGAPQAAGDFTFTVAVSDAGKDTAQKPLSLAIAAAAPAPPPPPSASGPVSLDEYGGVSGDPLPGGATGFFRVVKVGDHWLFADPDGNAFWMLGVFDVDTETSNDGLPGGNYNARVLAKYGGLAAWGEQAARRLKAWGFNTAAEYSSAYVIALDQYGARNTAAPIPSVNLVRPTYYALANQGNYAAQPVKDLLNGLDGNYKNYLGGVVGDVFDPNFAAYTSGFVAAGATTAMADSPWIVGTAVGDTDDLWGFGPGPGAPTQPAGQAASNLGWIALCTNFQQTSNSKYGVTYSDPKVYTKYALRDFLQTKYGTIAALDAAWGANYTTFDDAGGFGTGSGLLDEDGRDAWVGQDDVALSTAAPAVKVDLNAFLALYAQKYFSIVADAVRASFPRQLVFGPATLNGWNGVSRREVLAAAAQYVDVIQASAATQQVYDLTLQFAGDKPLVAWTGFPANADSDLFAYPSASGPQTQEQRASLYSSTLLQLYNFAGSSAAGSLAGSQNFVGTKFWAYTDSWGEKQNWGLVSFLDNPYDGKADVIAAGADAWGFPTGGEPRNFGDFIDGAAKANAQVMALAAAQH